MSNKTEDYPKFQIGDNGSFSTEEWKKFWDGLTATQQERIKDKATWEGCTLSGVLYNWPSILKGVE